MNDETDPPANDAGAEGEGDKAEPEPEKNRGGRPSKIRDEAVAKRLVQGLLRGMTPDLACDLAGIAPSTFYLWMKQGKEDAEAGLDTEHFRFSERIKKAIATALYKMLGKIKRGGEGWQGSAWVVERRWRETYARPAQVELSGPGGGAIQVQTLEDAIAKARGGGSSGDND